MCLALILHLGSFTMRLLPQWLLFLVLCLVSKCKEALEDFSVTCLKHISSNSFVSSPFPISVFNNGVSSQCYKLIIQKLWIFRSMLLLCCHLFLSPLLSLHPGREEMVSLYPSVSGICFIWHSFGEQSLILIPKLVVHDATFSSVCNQK